MPQLDARTLRADTSRGARVATYEFRFDPERSWLVRAISGATPDAASARLVDGDLAVRFGWAAVRTPLANVRDVRITRDYQWFRALGLRLSLSDRGATYGSSTVGGVCVCFHEPVRALPVGPANPGLTMTVADLDGFASALRAAAGLGD